MIKVLEKNVADKIAAGEVVERPLSIVKELVENSLDSNPHAIVVEIKNGGKSYIRVTDDGCGIPRDEVETAFLRHATSKIEKAGDLNSISTLGFRGEALASIAAVTHTELVTKTKDSKIGAKVLIHGGEVIENKSIGCPDGTTVIVSDLFYNTPARLKFLKSDSAESSQVIEFISEIALAYSHIKFRLINNGNIVFSTNGDGNGLNTIMSVFKQKEYMDLVPIKYKMNETSLHGFISKPSLSRTTRKAQIFFVNGRVINSKVIERGLKEGYRERLFDGRFPIAFLFIDTNPSTLDVNIHPNKREVRFDNELEIIELVSMGIKEGLSSKESVIEVKESSKDIFKLSNTKTKKENNPDEQVDIKKLLSTKREELNFCEEIIQPVISEKENEKLSCKPSINIDRPSNEPFDFNDLICTGSIFNTYITATDASNFYLIDQHAAHERIFYEKLVDEYLSSEKLKQPILTPIIIEVAFTAKEQEYDWLDSLEDMGYLIEEFGSNSYVIKEIPTFMTLSEAEAFAKEFIENIDNGTHLNNNVVIDKLITKSCKSAVKAHDFLSMDEINSLIFQLKSCVNPFSCPHGRPTFIKLTKYEIEKMFKRV